MFLETKTVAPIILSQTTIQTRKITTTAIKTVTEREKKPKTVFLPCETCGKTNHPTEECYYGANTANRPPPRHRRPERQNQDQVRGNQNDSNETIQVAAQSFN